MVQRSPMISAGLLLAPTLCVVALRFGLPNIEVLLKGDLLAQAIIHGIAIILGIIMYLRYRVVEDHEYHRSSAIKGLSNMYRLEDKGLWSRGDAALEKLEAQARTKPRGRAGIRFKQRMGGSISDLNKEGTELELNIEDSRMDIEVDVQGRATPNETNSAESEDSSKLTGTLGVSAEASAQRRLAKELARREKQAAREEKRAIKQAAKEAKAAAKAEKAAVKAAAKAEKAAAKRAANPPSNQTNWDEEDKQRLPPIPSSIAQSVISCQECGAVNNSGTAYCSSCGAFL
ncbi:MAG: zinc ribbon domain-containing protein [Candidatus Thalassarchaeum sp.]|nr:zinc ribbon domain-containing protein [Candidatus Thalassarchaeum sp.]MEC8938253.1 zinc ribbon domain-containing protein [Candidatus Thermoplasmatota archaeon]MEC8954909.1 zinc ribbon domain-containing protein [Candidatus Thermoplasmatota archaeon]MEC9351395.1 zinc ribbon domain-containing protein [Candidatus Thermoplasmatota archaeon]MEC9394008.1 zinc ribbon domain-containing protein [Candidatus Thermoplasmatota archaeon]